MAGMCRCSRSPPPMSALHGMPMGRENRPLFAWYGDMELVPHLWEALKAGPLDVVVQFHEPLSLDDMDRKELGASGPRKPSRCGQAEALQGRVVRLGKLRTDGAAQNA